jgi:hypothetical protein
MWRLETSRVELRKDRGIYIIMYKNLRVILQEVQGGFMCERGIFWGGSLEDSQDTKIDLIVIGKGRGLTAKPLGLLLPSDPRVQGAAVACPAKLLALRRPSGLDELQNWKRSSRGSQGGAYRRGRQTVAARTRPVAELGVAGGGTQGQGELQGGGEAEQG